MSYSPNFFLGRTVFVKNGQVEEAMRIVNRIMSQEGFFERHRRNKYYEKPHKFRRRINYERCKAVYAEEMERKIRFISRKSRLPGWIGSE